MPEVRLRAACAVGYPAPEAPRPLREAVKALCPQAPRRLNRYTELALLGALGCANQAGIELPAHCGLFLATGQGYGEDVLRLLEGMLVQGQSPMPVEFINVSGSSAGFYLAQVLGLRGRNLATSAGPVSFEAALELAWTALSAEPGLALVGGVDDAGYPLASHRSLLGLTPEQAVAELSSWVLLDSRGGEEGRRLAEPLHGTELERLAERLAGGVGPVALGAGLAAPERARLEAAAGERLVAIPAVGQADTLGGYAVARLAERYPRGGFQYVNGDGTGACYLVEVSSP